jgi:DNA-binding winged helix-turn-helix (wHTH) protein
VFDLLVHLIRNRDRIVSKDELFERFGRDASSRRRR